MASDDTGEQQAIYVVFDNGVYDVTQFAKRHPGGSSLIVDNNRKDITLSFNKIGHSRKALNMLNKMFVCPVADWKDPATSAGESVFCGWCGC